MTLVALRRRQVAEHVRVLVVTAHENSMHVSNQHRLSFARVHIVLAQEFDKCLRRLIVEYELKIDDEIGGNEELES